jgi:beta-lactam-binding protein with PASTA domain
MSLLDFIKSKTFLINLILGIVFLTIFWGSILFWLDSYTMHGESITVPELVGLSKEEAEIKLQEKGLRLFITDSLYNPKALKGGVLEQEPKANSQVKHNRTIYVTVNAMRPPLVKMPDLHDLTLRDAKARLETYGLQLGNIRYVPDIAFNAVVFQEYKGKKIEAGEMIERGSVIDLALGQGESNEMVNVPLLTGLSIKEAIEQLQSNSLNIGAIIKDETVKDSTQAKVYKQIPPYSEDAFINVGKSVDIFVTQSKEKLSN